MKRIYSAMTQKIISLLCCVILWGAVVSAQEAQKSDLQKRAEALNPKENVAQARSLFIQAYHDYSRKGQIREAVECAAKASALYYQENSYQEAFDLLRESDQLVSSSKQVNAEKAALHYQMTRERMQMYIKMRRAESAKAQLDIMEGQVSTAGEETLKNDLLYQKAIYFYTFGHNAQGNAVFQEMASKLTSEKAYDKVDEVYQTLIANGRKSGSANMVAQAYSSYIVWKDSVNALKRADEIGALKKQIADNEAVIADKDSALSTRWVFIIGLCVVVAALAAALVIGAIILLRYILLTRKQQKTIKLANESNALKAQFISNMSAQLEPTLRKLDSRQPEVQALLDFSKHVQTLSELENRPADAVVEQEETQVATFCESLMDEIRDSVKSEVTLTVNAPKMSANINREMVSHILRHLLVNAAEYTPEEGHIWLEYKKRGQHTYQFLVSNTGEPIPEEKRDSVFTPFAEIHDLTQGDGLGLPICKQMALKMNGDLTISEEFTKGTRFVLELHG